RRKGTDRDLESRLRRERLQRHLPCASAIAVAPTAIGRDEKFLAVGVGATSHLSPPYPNGLDREGRGVMVDTDADPPGVLAQIVDTVRDGFAEPFVLEVVNFDSNRPALGLPLPS